MVVRSPESLPVCEIERFLDTNAQWVSRQLERQSAIREAYPELTSEEERRLRKCARDCLPGRVMYYAEIMGVEPSGVKITSAKTRFGSCNAKNSLCFSYRLMRYPDEAIDYVVVHELAHILHKNHGKEFYAVIESVLPDYRARMKMLSA